MQTVIPLSGQGQASSVQSHANEATDPASPLAAVPAGAYTADAASSEAQLQLLRRLLDCRSKVALLQRFHGWARVLGLCDGISYQANSAADLQVLGTPRQHQLRCELQLAGRHFGVVSFFRSRRYGENERKGLELALEGLTLALRAASDFEALQSLVLSDPLTGLGNRAGFDQAINSEVARARRYSSALAVLMVDVDYFKAINDAYGHGVGDQALRHVAEGLRESTRGSDLLFRFGGDEFVVLLPHTQRRGAVEAAAQIRRQLRLQRTRYGHETPVPDVSIGVGCYATGDDASSLLRKADMNLYRAKRQRRS